MPALQVPVGSEGSGNSKLLYVCFTEQEMENWQKEEEETEEKWGGEK